MSNPGEVDISDDRLRCSVVDGKLVIEIGIETLAFACINSPFVWEMCEQDGPDNPVDRFQITDPIGFAHDVISEALSEREDGSSLLTDFFDKVCQQAVEQGSEHFIDNELGY